jgi:hypothetical protein
MKSNLLFVFVFVFLLVGTGSVLSATCNGTGNIINSTTITNGCTLNSAENYFMSGETFYIDNSSVGAIIIETDDIYLDCNSSYLIGNNSYGFNISSNLENITIKNCYMQDYSKSIYGIGLNYSNFLNNYFYNSTDTAIYLEKGSNFNLINNNTLNYTSTGISIQGISIPCTNNTISDNYLFNTSYNAINLFALVNYNIIENNVVNFVNNNGVGILFNRDVNNNIAKNNIVYNTKSDGMQIRGYTDGGLTGNSTNNLFLNNTIVNASYSCILSPSSCAQGILLNYYSVNNSIINNTVIDANGNCYESGLNSTDNLFQGNIGSSCSGSALEINGENSAWIFNNIFSNPLQYAYSFNAGSFILGFSGYPEPDIDKDYFYIKNENLFNIEGNFTNLTNALIYYSNNSIAGSSNIDNNDGNINIILTPNNYSYVYDNFKQQSATTNLSIFYQFNENQGTTAYDSSGNSNDGTISGATWATDGLFVLLTEGVDYSLSTTTGLFTILNTDYSWSEITTSWNYISSSGKGASNSFVSEFGAYTTLIGLLGTIIFLALIITILVGSFKFSNKGV